MKKHILIISFFIALTSCWAQQNSINTLKGKELKTSVRFSYIPVNMPTEEVGNGIDPRMGMMGLQYLIPFNQNFYGGVGMHAALFGDQGGLFTLGATLGYNQQLFKNIFLDANIHFGGGGGYRYLVNGGAILNPNIGLQYKKNRFAAGIQYSMVNFVDGIIKSDGVSFFVEIPSLLRVANYEDSQKTFITKNIETDSFWNKPTVKNAQQVRFDYFFPIGNSKKDNLEELINTLHVIGFEYQKYLSEKSFIYVHTDAIYKGLTAGFMDLYFGAGHNFVSSNKINLFAKFGIGAAGGRVAPEGGFMMYPSAGFDVKLFNKFTISAHGGYTKSLDGSLEAYTAGFGLKYFNYSGGVQKTPSENYNFVRTQGIRLAIENQTYLDVKRFEETTENLQLVAVKIMYDLSKNWYLTGEASFAYLGKSGGYAHGIVGAGYKTPKFINQKFSTFLEIAVGAAGGGRVDTDEGIVYRPLMGLNYHLNTNFTLYASGGKIIAPFGNVNSSNFNIGLSYKISIINSK